MSSEIESIDNEVAEPTQETEATNDSDVNSLSDEEFEAHYASLTSNDGDTDDGSVTADGKGLD